jgi:hypothetical protein
LFPLPGFHELIAEGGGHQSGLDGLAGAAPRIHDNCSGGTGDIKDGLTESERTAAEPAVWGLADIPEEIDEVTSFGGDNIGPSRAAETSRAAVRDI